MRPVRRLPETFRSPWTLPVLNVLAVGLSLAAGTVAVFHHVFGRATDFGFAAMNGIPTFVYGVIWAALLRHRATLGRTTVRVGWLASIPLAMANAATACGLLFWRDDPGVTRFLGGAIAGATFGVIVWGPALIVTLLCFGAPIAHAQHLAKKGLAGEERGEVVVGAAASLVALGAIALLLYGGQTVSQSGPGYAMFTTAMAVLGAVAGLTAFTLAARRENERRAFVRAVEAGEVEGYRVDPTEEGKVLVCITSMGEGYRVGSFVEPVFGLDEEGHAQRSMVLVQPSSSVSDP